MLNAILYVGIAAFLAITSFSGGSWPFVASCWAANVPTVRNVIISIKNFFIAYLLIEWLLIAGFPTRAHGLPRTLRLLFDHRVAFVPQLLPSVSWPDR